MKKFILIMLFFLAALTACKKSNNTGPSVPGTLSVTASINGRDTSFSSIITVDTSSTPGTIYIVAHSDSSNLTPLLEITLYDSTTFKTGIYTSSLTNGRLGLLGYTGWTGDTAEQFFSSSDTVDITTINKIALAGTFQGTCQYADSTITITNGMFAVRFGHY